MRNRVHPIALGCCVPPFAAAGEHDPVCRMHSFLLVVFDGLRPDMVRPDTTPNLLRFTALGTQFVRARSVFPSEPRVCSSSVATVCLPLRHGLVANQLAAALDPSR